jgi:hypothetical protein
MNNTIREIIIGILSGIGAIVFQRIWIKFKQWKTNNNSLINNNNKVIKTIVLYTILAILTTLVFIFLEISKSSLLILFILLLFFSFFFAKDVLYFSLVFDINRSKKKELKAEKLSVLLEMEQQTLSKERLQFLVKRLIKIENELK